jgi:hypothetical protein
VSFIKTGQSDKDYIDLPSFILDQSSLQCRKHERQLKINTMFEDDDTGCSGISYRDIQVPKACKVNHLEAIYKNIKINQLSA